jgi:uncharacterized membrane protein YecN with MAPEG domain
MPPAYAFPVTLTFAAALALINLWLALRCSQVRHAHGITTGAGGNPQLEARMRAHANFVEYTPFMLILMALIEATGASKSALFWIGVVYVAGRLAHPLGMDRRDTNVLRAGGVLATWGVLLALAGWAFWLLFTTPSHAVATRLM